MCGYELTILITKFKKITTKFYKFNLYHLYPLQFHFHFFITMCGYYFYYINYYSFCFVQFKFTIYANRKVSVQTYSEAYGNFEMKFDLNYYCQKSRVRLGTDTSLSALLRYTGPRTPGKLNSVFHKAGRAGLSLSFWRKA